MISRYPMQLFFYTNRSKSIQISPSICSSILVLDMYATQPRPIHGKCDEHNAKMYCRPLLILICDRRKLKHSIRVRAPHPSSKMRTPTEDDRRQNSRGHKVPPSTMCKGHLTCPRDVRVILSSPVECETRHGKQPHRAVPLNQGNPRMHHVIVR
jgi:hypothetical protein